MRLLILLLTIGVSLAYAKPLAWPKKIRDPFVMRESSGLLKAELIALHYADPKKVAAVLKNTKNNFLSPQGVAVAE
ncbi:MAG: hypothetical protein COB66_08620, partial [Coxiella sp. (in: Bacteria)]